MDLDIAGLLGQLQSIKQHANWFYQHNTQPPIDVQEEIKSLIEEYNNARRDFGKIRDKYKFNLNLEYKFYGSTSINKHKALLREIDIECNKAIGVLESVASPLSKEDLEFDFWSMIHKDIIKVAKDKFEDGYYADAVESAFKEINRRVKEIVKKKIGKELDGASLMQHAFSEKNPIIALDDLSSETGKDIQKGYMQIFAGAMTGIRNPKAHANIDISRERAMHFIILASLLMYKLDEALRP